MAYPGTLNSISIGDGPNLDAFSRLRSALPQLRLSALFDYDKRPLFWGEQVTAGGLATHLPNERSVAMAVTAAGDAVLRQTKEYFVYRAGQSQLIFATFDLATEEAGLYQEIGYGDANNGIFLVLDELDGPSFTLRSFTSGIVDNNNVLQAAWNLDPLDGTGPSGVILNPERTQILVIDFQWLGVGRVRLGFDIDGQIVYAHEFRNANTTLTTVYMTTPKLPVRYYIVALPGYVGGGATMTQICSTVIREGGTDEPGVQRSIDSGTANVTLSTAWETVVGFRLQAGAIRASLRVVEAALINLDGTNSVEFAALLIPAENVAAGGTAAAVWANVAQPNSIAQYSRTNTAITVDGSGDPTQGVMLPLFGFAGAAQAGRGGVAINEIGEVLGVFASIAGTPDECWLIARGLGGTPAVRGIIAFEEIR